MMKRLLFIIMGALIVLLGALVQPAEAAHNCAKRQHVTSKLKQQYQETATAIGLSNTGGVYEIFTSPAGTWTIVYTRPDGFSCLMAVGDNWETMTSEPTDIKIQNL